MNYCTSYSRPYRPIVVEINEQLEKTICWQYCVVLRQNSFERVIDCTFIPLWLQTEALVIACHNNCSCWPSNSAWDGLTLKQRAWPSYISQVEGRLNQFGTNPLKAAGQYAINCHIDWLWPQNCSRLLFALRLQLARPRRTWQEIRSNSLGYSSVLFFLFNYILYFYIL